MILLALMSAAAMAVQAPRSEPLLHDDRGRPMIRARLNDRGPFDMIVDTAAQTSLIVPSVAADLGIAPLDEEIGVEGATGRTSTKLYPIDRFSTSVFDQRDVAMPALPNIGSTSARGIIGLEAFEGRKLVFDRKNALLRADPSGPPEPGYVAQKGHVDGTGFLVIPVVLDGVTIQAVVDTGAAVTVANGAVLKALGWATDDARLKLGGEIRGASAHRDPVRSAVIEHLILGPVKLSNVPIIFTGSGGGAVDPPSLLLGSDLLNLLEAYAVDVGRAELQIRLPG